MLRVALFLIMAAAPLSKAAGQIRVFPVDLFGDPIPDIEVVVRFPGRDPITLTNDNGIASSNEALPAGQPGEIQVNDTQANSRYIRRREQFEASEQSRFRDGIAIPMWEPGDVKSLARSSSGIRSTSPWPCSALARQAGGPASS